VKLLFDENLSPRLARVLSDLYPDSTHVHGCGLGSEDDSDVWQFAKANLFTIVSKDSDFSRSEVLHGHPPKFIWIRAENCSTQETRLSSERRTVIKEFINADQESYLALGARRKPGRVAK
jgi:predicted nuclease of predicted toxin-antitoxin system